MTFFGGSTLNKLEGWGGNIIFFSSISGIQPLRVRVIKKMYICAIYLRMRKHFFSNFNSGPPLRICFYF